MAFLPEINGLRAWAVVIVVLYHFGVPGFDGGFVGVDVFFVISGFLMTGIVVRGLEAGRLSLMSFYIARARRIVPSLWFLCAVLLVLGWFVLLPPDYKMLGTHAVTAMTFWSNIRFTQEAGYFDAASHDKWLLHTWSLSVEWQFYLVLPLLLMVVWRFSPSRRSLLAAVLAAGFGSFAASVWLTQTDASHAFFALHTRAWEMLVGGALFLAQSRDAKAKKQRVGARWAQALGFVLIGCAVFGFDTTTSWPGWRAAVPVAGAALIIWARCSTSLLTGFPLAQWLGDRSYSLYLWHWPVVVALTYLGLQADPIFVLLGLAASVLLGAGSYHWVEAWGRRPPAAKDASTWRLFVTYTLGISLLCAPAVAVWRLDGVPGRSDPIAEAAAAQAKNTNPKGEKCVTPSVPEIRICQHGGPDVKLILLGDSHSNAVASAVEAALPSSGTGFVQMTYAACPMVRNAQPTPGTFTHRRRDYQCSAAVGSAIARLQTELPGVPLLIVTRASLALLGLNEEGAFQPPEFYVGQPVQHPSTVSIQSFQAAYAQTVCEFAESRPVFLLRPIPEMGFNVPQRASRQLAAGVRVEIRLPLQDYMFRNEQAWKMQDMARSQCGAQIVDATPLLCPGGACMATRDFLPLYADDDHLSESGNRLLTPLFKDLMR
jgi:peptidoglycan/LPS O-acetylase OafA/YrhL